MYTKRSNIGVLKFLLITLTVSVFSNIIYAYPIEAKYCPQKVECHMGDCKASGSDVKYWVGGGADGKVPMNGVYNFSEASGTYQAKGVTSISCGYKFSGTSPFPLPKIGVVFSIKQPGNFEASLDGTTNWVLSDFNNVKCFADTPLLCPVIEKTSLLIEQSIVGKDGYYLKSLPLVLATNGIVFSRRDPNLHSRYISITYEDALNACGNVNQCTIYIAEQDDILKENLATVTIDMNNKMRIIGVTTPKRATYGVVRKHPLFNLIQFVEKQKK